MLIVGPIKNSSSNFQIQLSWFCQLLEIRIWFRRHQLFQFFGCGSCGLHSKFHSIQKSSCHGFVSCFNLEYGSQDINYFSFSGCAGCGFHQKFFLIFSNPVVMVLPVVRNKNMIQKISTISVFWLCWLWVASKILPHTKIQLSWFCQLF